MAQSSYGVRPLEHLHYAVLHAGKKVQFPAFGFSPERSEEQHVDQYSLVLDTPHKQHDDPLYTDVVKLQQQLETTKAVNAVLKHSTEMEQMRHEFDGLQARKAELEKTFTAPQFQVGEV